jgi:hypothetical protein
MLSIVTPVTLMKIFAHCAATATTKSYGTRCRTICAMWCFAPVMKLRSQDAATFGAHT